MAKQALYLRIKGPTKSAKRAAARHDVPVFNCHAGTHDEVSCHAPCKPGVTNRVIHWFTERSPSPKQGRGYSPGTLLFHSGACPRGMGGLGRTRRRRRR